MASAVWLAALGAFICSLDSALNVAFPAISSAFAVAPDRIALLIVFYHVPIGILTVLGGLLGDRFGHRRVFACGLWTTALSFPLCGLAPDYALLLAGRAVQGVGAGLVFGTAPALVTLSLSRDRRAPGLGVLGVATGAGLAVAPLLAGLLIDAFGWRSVFFFRVPLALAAALVVWRRPPRAVTPRPPARPERMRDVPHVSTRLVLRDVLAAAANCAFFSTYIFVPYYLVDVARYSATAAGVIFTMLPLCTSLGSLAGGSLAGRFSAERLVVAGLGLETAGLCALTAVDVASGALLVAVGLALTGGGLGLFQVPNTALVMAALPDRSQGAAGGMITAMRTVGIVTAAFGGPRLFAAREAAHAASGGPERFVAAFSDTFLVSAVLGAAGLALAVALWTTARHR